ncbi:MAG: hypothetical protein WC330_01115, partial [Candidatus Omnitrophota bacterium]
MKKIISIVAIFSFIFSSIAPAFAADAVWNGTTDAVWATGTNWSATPVPGTGNTATFNNAGGAIDIIDISGGIAIKSIVFDTGAVSYTIGDGLHADTLALDNLGVIQMTAGVLNDQTFNANITLGGAGAFQNYSSTNTLTFNGTVNSASGTEDLTLTAGTGNMVFAGAVGTTNSLEDLKIVSVKNLTTAAITAETITQDGGTGATTFNGAVNTSAAGGVNIVNETIAVNSGITTTGNGIVTLNADTATLTI